MRTIHATVLTSILFGSATVEAQKLTYRQRQALERMTWTVKDIEKNVLPKYKDTSWLGKKTWTVPELNQHINATNNAFKKLNDAIIHMNKAGCTTAQPPVKALVARINSGRATLQKAGAALQVAAKKSSAAGSASSYKDYKADMARAKSIADVFQIADVMVQSDQVEGAGPEFKNAVNWLKGRETFYKPFFHQRTQPAQQLDRALKRARSVLTRFKRVAQKFINDAPAAIKRELDDGERQLAHAVENSKPAYLGGGVKQNIDLVGKRLKILDSLLGAKLPGWVTKDRARHKKLIAQSAAAGKAMAIKILGATRAPRDAYAGADKEKLRKMVRDAWAAKYPKDKILAVRLPVTQWKRRKRARWVADSWTFTDASWIQLRVIVKTSEERASLFVAYVTKDHVSKSVSTDVDSKDARFHVIEQMLIKNID